MIVLRHDSSIDTYRADVDKYGGELDGFYSINRSGDETELEIGFAPGDGADHMTQAVALPSDGQ